MVQEGELALTGGSAGNIPESTKAALTFYGDTITDAEEAPVVKAIILSAPEEVSESAPLRSDNSMRSSYLLCALFFLFFIIAIRIRGNYKYIPSLFHNLTETRTRHNVFDDTVRETSLMILLNLLWCGCAGAILGIAVTHYSLIIDFSLLSVILICIVATVIYIIFMYVSYWGTGWIFSDKERTEMWIKGYSSSLALMTPFLFIFALVGICRPDAAVVVTIGGSLTYIFFKSVFIWK